MIMKNTTRYGVHAYNPSTQMISQDILGQPQLQGKALCQNINNNSIYLYKTL